MAHIILKSERTKQQEQNIMRQFGGNRASTVHREFAECINARTDEAVRAMRKEGTKIWR